jgi:hypothetical protein
MFFLKEVFPDQVTRLLKCAANPRRRRPEPNFHCRVVICGDGHSASYEEARHRQRRAHSSAHLESFRLARRCSPPPWRTLRNVPPSRVIANPDRPRGTFDVIHFLVFARASSLCASSMYTRMNQAVDPAPARHVTSLRPNRSQLSCRERATGRGTVCS